MNSFSIQAVKDTLNDMHGVITSKVIPVVGTFLGHSVTLILANPLATVAVVAAVITVSIVIFAAYKHYQFHQQLKADNASLKNFLGNASVDLKQENKKKTALIKENEVKVEKALEIGNFAVECQNSEIEKVTAKLKEVKADLKTAGDVQGTLSNENSTLQAKIKELEKDRALDQEAAEQVVSEQFVKIQKLEKQILSK